MSASALAFDKVGSTPTENLHFHHFDPPDLQHNEVLIKMIAAPVNPQDIMVLLGRYPVSPSFKINEESIPGYDGVARVTSVHPSVLKDGALKPGDLVIPTRHGVGTWRTHAVLPANLLLKISSEVDCRIAAVLRMGVTPAYLLLEDMAVLRPGDWIIQNAASGVIAQFVTQFAQIRGLHTISVVRDREDIEQLRAELQSRGADIVITQSELEAKDAASFEKEGKRIMLALDAVFGHSGSALATQLSPDATYINYGSLGDPQGTVGIQITQQQLFWKQITFKNFRLTQCLGMRSQAQINDMMTWFGELAVKGFLQIPRVETVQWSESVIDLIRLQSEGHKLERKGKYLILFPGNSV
jgi:trans-2-enoyl-CoA reductase